MFIGCEKAHHVQQGSIHRSGRRGIINDDTVSLRRKCRVICFTYMIVLSRLSHARNGVSYGLSRDLVLQQYDIRLQDRVQMPVDVLFCDQCVCAGNDRDGVIVFRNHDHCYAAGYVLHSVYMTCLYAIGLQILDKTASETVITHTSEHGHITTEARRSNCLVGSLAARNISHGCCAYSFTWARDTSGCSRHIHIYASYHRNFLHTGRSSLICNYSDNISAPSAG